MTDIFNFMANMLKKLIKALCLLLIPALCFAQKNCNYDRDEYDKFQKLRKLEKEVKVVRKFNRGNGYLELRLCKYGELCFFRLYTGFENSVVVGQNDAVIFLLENDETIKVYPDKIYTSDFNGYRSSFEGTYFFSSHADIDKLQSVPTKSVRFYYNDVYHDFDLKGNGQKDLMNAIQCF